MYIRIAYGADFSREGASFGDKSYDEALAVYTFLSKCHFAATLAQLFIPMNFFDFNSCHQCR